MSLKKSLIVAQADIKMALKVRYVRYGLIGMSALAPIMVIVMIPLPVILDPASAAFILPFIMPFAGTMLAMFSIMPAAMIGANSFVGEREQKTLEPLLCTPLTDNELLIGKTLSAFIPSVWLLTGSTSIVLFVSNILFLIAGQPLMLVPDVPGLFMVFIVGPIGALSVISVMIIISGRVSRVYEAYQTSSVIIMLFMIPMFLPMFSYENPSGIMDAVWFGNIITFLIALVLVVVTWAIAWRQFSRDRMVTMI